MKISLYSGMFLAATVVFLSGCATSQLQTSVKMTQSIFVNPVATEKQTIFVSIKNTSGADIMLKPRMAQALANKGYSVVDNPEKASYILMANVLYCNKKSENNVGSGALMGGTTGVILNSGSSGRGIVAAGLVGAVVGGLIGKATEDSIYQMQVDVVIRENSKNKVNVFSETTSVQGNGYSNSNMYASNSQSHESHFIEHRTVVFAEATKMDLTLDEAIPVLEQKIAHQIAGIF